MDNEKPYTIKPAGEEHIPQAASLFWSAFSGSIEHYFGHRPPNIQVMIDLMSFIREVEPGCFLVAEARPGAEGINGGSGPGGSRILGYIIAPTSMRRLRRRALSRGYLLRWFGGLLTGRYGLGFRALLALSLNKLGLIRNTTSVARDCGARGMGQILSLAVAGYAQGRGIGTDLLCSGITYLRNAGIPLVKLEVRTGNHPARHIYDRLGFLPVRTLKDSMGKWMVMIRNTSDAVRS